MRLTAEQQNVIELAEKGESLKVQARAGAGKTSVLVATAKEMAGKGHYIAFNKSIADEAGRKFGGNVTAKTAHSMAYAVKGRQLAHRLKTRLTGRMVAERFALREMQITRDQTLSAISQGYIVIDMINLFTQGGDSDVGMQHANYNSFIVKEGDDSHVENIKKSVFESLLPVARSLWADLSNPYGHLPITHDTYLKLWALDNPKINSDFILFDEAQDASGVMLDILRNQQAQIILVGDDKQQIYSWRGASNAMQRIKTTHTAHMTQSFRFGQPIADVAMQIISRQLQEDMPLRGFERIQSSVSIDGVSDHDAILCRTNAACISKLAEQVAKGKKAAMVGDVSSMINTTKAICTILGGGRAIGELSVFDNKQEYFEYLETSQGADLKPITKMIFDYGADQLIGWLEASKNTEDADVFISTAHRAKGLEWDSVLLADDFLDVLSDGWTSESANLLYVAATRAKNVLDVSRCHAVQLAMGLHSQHLQNAA